MAPGATSATQGALVPAEQDLDAEAGAWDDDGVDDGPLIGKDAAFGITEGDAAAPKKRRRRRKPAAKRVSEGGEPSQSPAPAPAAPSHEGV